MKHHFALYFVVVVTLLSIGTVENVPVIHPRPIVTLPNEIHHAIGASTPGKGSSAHSPWPSRNPTQSIVVASSSLRPTSSATDERPHRPQYSSRWSRRSTVENTILRFSLYVALFACLTSVFRCLCNATQRRQAPSKPVPVALKNKMYVSAIDGKRQESPPIYVAQLHHV